MLELLFKYQSYPKALFDFFNLLQINTTTGSAMEKLESGSIGKDSLSSI
jgi:hypothetical protein